MKNLLIFDLDGTLLNTVADLAESTNYALRLCGFPTHEAEAYKFFVGNGINKLFERALPVGEKTQENILKIRHFFLEFYGTHNTELTVPYPGIPALLQKLQSEGVKLAVASNKYQKGTEELIQHFFPEIKFVAVFGQRENVPSKPDPTIVHDILTVAKVEKQHVLYIGDSGVDMQTARNSGIDAAGVTWGFRPRSEMEEFSPKYLVENPSEILSIVFK
ncbi:MAG: HAD family hydrolase [Bacteroidota bacterium]|nr:HAD family hydrolase [Bacteroidota bacterium]